MIKKATLFMALLFVSSVAFAADNTYLVSSLSDKQQEGTLRTILHYACDSDGSDLVKFAKTRLDQLRIYLKRPLVIPEDCKGPVTMMGSDEAETILDASDFEGTAKGSNCTLDIYSNANAVAYFGFSGNRHGAAVCVYGRSNDIFENRMGVEKYGSLNENVHGIVVSKIFSKNNGGMNGSFTTIRKNIIGQQPEHGIIIDADSVSVTKNEITSSGGHGIQLEGDGIEISENIIAGNGGCPPKGKAIEGQEYCYDGDALGGAGIYIKGGSSNVLIGGDNFEERNIIQFNRNGGVVLYNSKETDLIKITHNQISKNYGTEVGIDMRGDGVTENDILDLDVGPNALLNFPEHLQAFRLVGDRHWIWGVSFFTDDIELYGVAPEDFNRGVIHGGGDSFYGDMTIASNSFEAIHNNLNFSEAKAVTAVGLAIDGNTSEYSLNAGVSMDEDYDGILDELETGDGTKASGGTSPDNADSDGDELPDPIEDRNRNGEWEPELGELCAYNPDTDNDGISDGAETHGDGVYDKGRDTDPCL